MKRTTRNAQYYALLLLQSFLAFMLGIFGNEIAELISITPLLVLICAFGLLYLLFAVSVALDSHEVGARFSFTSLWDTIRTPIWILIPSILNRIVSAFPFGIMSGMIIATLCTYVLPFPREPHASIYFLIGISIWAYEIIAYICALAFLHRINTFAPDRVILLTVAVGLAVGVAVTVVFMRPFDNQFGSAIIKWLIIGILAGFAIGSATLRGLIGDLHTIVEKIFSPR